MCDREQNSSPSHLLGVWQMQNVPSFPMFRIHLKTSLFNQKTLPICIMLCTFCIRCVILFAVIIVVTNYDYGYDYHYYNYNSYYIRQVSMGFPDKHVTLSKKYMLVFSLLSTIKHSQPGTKHRWTVRSHWTPEHFSLRTASIYLAHNIPTAIIMEIPSAKLRNMIDNYSIY